MEPSTQPALVEYCFRESARYASLDIPAWATRFQRETFNETGLVFRDHKTKTGTRPNGTIYAEKARIRLRSQRSC